MAKSYSLWKLEHESIYTVTAHKEKDTNSIKVVQAWMDKSLNHAASCFRKEKELNAAHLSTFNRD